MKAFTNRLLLLALFLMLTGVYVSKAVDVPVTIHILNSSGLAFESADLISPSNCFVEYYASGVWQTPVNVTLSGGDFNLNLPSNTTSLKVDINWRQSAQINGINLALNSEFTFQTEKVKLSLASCVDGSLLDYDKVTFWVGSHPGSIPTSGYIPFPAPVDGWTSLELLPGNHIFDMWLNGTHSRISDNIGIIPEGDYELQFTARLFSVDLAPNMSSIKFYAGGWRIVPPEGLYLFAGSYQFQLFYTNGTYTPQFPIKVEACSGQSGFDPGTQEGTIASVKLESSAGGGWAGGKVYTLNGTWNPFGLEILDGAMESFNPPQYNNVTPASGMLYFMLPGNKTNVIFHMTYRGGDQEITQNMQLNANVVFKTKKVGISLLNSLGNIQPGGTLRFYEPTGWFNLGTTDATCYIDLLADKYYFDVKYLDQTLVKQFNVGTITNFNFNTRKVHVGLFDTRTTPATEITTNFVVKYLAGTWMNFGSIADPYNMEMLPVAQSINCNYMSKNKQKNLSATVNNLVFNWNGTILYKLGIGELASDGITNEPNPFNDKTNIKFNLTSESSVKVSVYNAAGTEVSNLFEGTLKAGDHEYMFRSDGLSSGAYYCIISVDGVPTLRPMLIAK